MYSDKVTFVGTIIKKNVYCSVVSYMEMLCLQLSGKAYK